MIAVVADSDRDSCILAAGDQEGMSEVSDNESTKILSCKSREVSPRVYAPCVRVQPHCFQYNDDNELSYEKESSVL
jgi:hypothetical protein